MESSIKIPKKRRLNSSINLNTKLLFLLILTFNSTLFSQEAEIDHEEPENTLPKYYSGVVSIGGFAGVAYWNKDLNDVGIEESIIFGGEILFQIESDISFGAYAKYVTAKGNTQTLTALLNTELTYFPIGLIGYYRYAFFENFLFEIGGGLAAVISKLDFTFKEDYIFDGELIALKGSTLLSYDRILIGLTIPIKFTYAISNFHVSLFGAVDLTGKIGYASTTINNIKISESSSTYNNIQLGGTVGFAF